MITWTVLTRVCVCSLQSRTRATATLWSSERCWSGSTWRIWGSRPTPATTSCTDAVSWKRWASKTQIQTASHSGREGERESARRVKTHTLMHTQNPKPQRYSSVHSRESLYCFETIPNLFLSISTLSCLFFSPVFKRRTRPRGKSSWGTCSVKRKRCDKCLSTK